MSQINPTAFTHLRVHSHYSLLKSVASVDALVQRATDAGMSALALTDKCSLYGAVAFKDACHRAAIQPITGMTVPIAPPKGAPSGRDDEQPLGQLLLLATNRTGYASLCALSACLQAHPDRESRLQRGLSWMQLNTHHHGLIAIEAGKAGWLARLLQAGERQAATQYMGRLAAIFMEYGYIGLELANDKGVALAQEMVQIGGRFGFLPIVAQPVVCLEPADAELLPLLTAIDQNCRIETVASPPADLWLSLDEIATRFAAFPEAIARVGEVIARCEPALPDGRTIWPKLNVPADETAESMLIRQAKTGLTAHLAAVPILPETTVSQTAVSPQHTPYKTRLKRELTMINAQGFAPLFLMVADIVRFAREQAIPVSTRGSVANSLTAYVLGITTVDPVALDLLFERFLNPARANLPDIDLDFCSRRRDEVLAYVRATYGEDRVALVGTMNRMQSKSAVRETAKAYGLGASQIKHLSSLMPSRWHPDESRRERFDGDAILAALEDETEKKVVQHALRLIGQPHHLGLHPGGIVITPSALTDFIPVQWAAKGYVATQYPHQDVEAIGLPKIDLLGIRALTVLADTAVSIRARHAPNFRLEEIPLDDKTTSQILSRGETIGVFQCESSGAQRTLRQLKATTVRDLAVANAFFKPGPATGGMAKAFVRRYRGEEKASYLHPALEPILSPTQGVLLFQEQVLRIAVEVAGLSWAQADHLRRGMSKFKAREMATMQRAFTNGCQLSPPAGAGFTVEQAEKLWEQIIAFAGYGFNQGHATAYADVSYRSAYLKAHYPAEFLCARLADHGGFHHPAIYIAEARRLGIAVQPPHVNVSGRKATLVTGDTPTIWLGLGQIKHLRRQSVARIVEKRPFTSLSDLLERVPLQAKEIRHLIQCGALDGWGNSRAELLAQAEAILRAGSGRQMAFGFAVAGDVVAETAVQQFEWEMALLGMPVSVNPLQLHPSSPTLPVRQLPDRVNQRIALSGFRLPGWTGGKGWFLSDGDSFVIVRGGKRPSAWEKVGINGRYLVDNWGGGWFQAG